jgi:CBS domain containing-hemolysin-like protein
MVGLVTAGAVAVVLLLAASAFFSATEIAVFSLERHRLPELLDRAETDPGAAALGRLRENPHRLLVTILVGNNVVNVALAGVSTLVLADLLGPGLGLLAATALASSLVLLFGEISPKAYGVANAESVSLAVARPLAVVQFVLSPLVVLFDALSRGVNRLTGGDRDIERPYVTREDIAALLRTGEEAGTIAEEERDMVEAVFDLSSTTAREVMVPRADVVAVDVTTPLEEVLGVCATHRLTRLPVYEDSLEHVRGVADIRDVERATREGLTLEDVLGETLQVPDTREIDDLLTEMQRQRIPLVVVRDEFGEFEGILTVEDILEQIVGDIVEVGEERLLRPTDEGLIVRGEVLVDEVNDALGLDLPTAGGFETVAGLVNHELGRIGTAGDVVHVGGATLTVESVSGNRVRRVEVAVE